jgi:hypothetical protein
MLSRPALGRDARAFGLSVKQKTSPKAIRRGVRLAFVDSFGGF